ncbi:MAG: DUF502 domain-containing protein [Proteobacteria bacterium]|nr:DUF502 domain-containing protein [Pseudomonadota bacterium]HQR04994.1 DUF502 domain-containing protein [Rhodocyclaceae bacterium]
MKKYFVTGLLIWIPVAITVWVLTLIVRTMDQSLLLLPAHLRPEELLGFYVPGLGVLLTLLVVVLTGLITTNIVGQRLVRFWESLLARIPVVKSIYYSVKQVSDTLFSGNGEAFRKVLLVRYPHPQAWSVAFQTSTPARDVSGRLDEEHVGVFIPTTPSPVNGFFFFVPKRDTVELDMTVDDALKYIVSMGVVAPVTAPVHGSRTRARNE